MKIDDLELSIRSLNWLKNAGIETVEQLLSMRYSQLQEIQNLGAKSLQEITWELLQLVKPEILERLRSRWIHAETEEKARRYDEIVAITNRKS